MARLKAEARIRLDAPGPIISRLCAALARHEVEVSEAAGSGRAVLGASVATMRAEPGLMVLAAEAEDEAALVTVKMALATHLLELAAEAQIVWTGDAAAVARPPNFREMRVLGTAALTPHMRRVTLAGPDLARYASGGLHVKLLIPPAGTVEPEWPVMGPNGLPVWPAGPARPALRTYTIRRIDVAAGRVDIDFALHGDEGPGSAWAERAQPGDRVGMLGPGGGTVGAADWYLLAGDETALPAIGRILETLPSDARGHAFVEVADAAEEQALARPPGVELVWLHRHGAAPGTTTRLQDAVRQVAWPHDGERIFAWAGAEFDCFRALRAHWREDHGLDKSRHLAVAYWRRGKAEGEFDKRGDA